MSVLVHPTEQRSRNMAAIRSRDTSLELRVRRAVHAQGFRYGLNRRDLPGKPDLVFRKYGLVALVHGCYWHGHVCKEAKRPNSNLSYWTPKIDGNMRRDELVKASLVELGWRVVVLRECTVEEDTAKLVKTLKKRKART